MRISNTAIPQKSPAFGSNQTIAKNIINGPLHKLAKSIEFNSMNMSFPVLLTVMFGGVLAPRLKQAQDKYDREEILRRDSISIMTIAFGAPILSKMFSKFNEMTSGLALTKKPKEFNAKSPIAKIVDYLRPVNGVHVLSSSEIVSKYSKIDNYEGGVKGFCDFIDSQKGSLKKVFGFTKETKDIVEDICGGKEAFESADNKKITEAIANAMKKTPEKIEELCKHFEGSNNKFVQKAKSMNSAFGFLSMVLLVPLFLGFVLPKVNEKITKRKIVEDKNTNPKPSEHHQIYQNPYFMASTQDDKTVFNKFNKD